MAHVAAAVGVVVVEIPGLASPDRLTTARAVHDARCDPGLPGFTEALVLPAVAALPSRSLFRSTRSGLLALIGAIAGQATTALLLVDDLSADEENRTHAALGRILNGRFSLLEDLSMAAAEGRSRVKREVNERIAALALEQGDGSIGYEFLCECSDAECVALVMLTLSEYLQRAATGAVLVADHST
jgi:hypothetical protein